ncbi:hypothetical protein O0881_10185 [Janthinobacterium sp. SUN100]|uniref:hypothetical protein n=1 Tax=Janthinobacterium sp. SUN100 TaxID=3004101 RepID=UPI0025B0DFC0|nr:hypothetical protein [Janthinobacterium sp. SUN100]MDN2702364.1 hypothetical protein [Janthinobacterium sp. SUN100]
MGLIQFFDRQKELSKIEKITEKRECPSIGFPPSCEANLFSGFFFDGTNNNMERDVALHSYSNVARLYRAFPGDEDTHGSDVWQCRLDAQLTVNNGVKARALSLGIDA